MYILPTKSNTSQSMNACFVGYRIYGSMVVYVVKFLRGHTKLDSFLPKGRFKETLYFSWKVPIYTKIKTNPVSKETKKLIVKAGLDLNSK